jgi:hypothetical protein
MRLVLFLSLLPALALAQGVTVKSGASTDTVTVDTNKNLRVTPGASTRNTFTATVSGATTTAAYNLIVESASLQGFKVHEICVSYALGATAAGTIITTTVRRVTLASSGGTALTNNGTGTTAVTDLSGNAVAYGGLARGLAATINGAGATIDQWQFPQTVVAGTTGITQPAVICRSYGIEGVGQAITVAAGVTNGIAVNVSAGGAGSLAVGSIRMTFIAE